MKQLVWVALLASASAGAAPECTHVSREHFVNGWEEAPSVELIHQRITPEGVVSCTYFPDPEHSLNVLARYEQGTMNGAAYKISYADGSAVIQGRSDIPPLLTDYTDNWRLVCKQAGAAPLYRCTLSRGDLRVEKDTNGQQRLGIGENHRKDSELLLRVDTNWAVTAPAASGFSTDQTLQLLAQMSNGKKADTRYYHAERQGSSDKTMTLFGFNQAVTIMDNVLKQLKTPPAE